jgi:hypothetical protein
MLDGLCDLTATEWATVATAVFTALAAAAALATVWFDHRRQKRSVLPRLYAQLGVDRDGSHHFVAVNGGLGVAIRPRFFGVDPASKSSFAGNLGTGWLRPGEEFRRKLNIPDVPATGPDPFSAGDVYFIYWCRDAEGRAHFWGSNDAYRVYPTGKLWWRREAPGTTVKDMWEVFHPGVAFPPIERAEWLTAGGGSEEGEDARNEGEEPI